MQNNIHFQEKNISLDPEAMRELQAKNISGVPTFIIGNDVIVGLDKQKILHLVDHRIVQCPNCAQKIRRPVNKGTIQVTCPKCAHQFQVNT